MGDILNETIERTRMIWSKLCEKEIRAAAEWWAAKLSTHPGRSNGRKGVDDPTGLANVLIQMDAASAKPADASQLEKFIDILSASISKRMDSQTYTKCLTIATDYHPDWTLSESANAVGIDLKRFPWKTVMWVEPGFVYAKPVYHPNEEVIFPEGSYMKVSGELSRLVGETTGRLTINRLENGSYEWRLADLVTVVRFQSIAEAVESADLGHAEVVAECIAKEWKAREPIQCDAKNGEFQCYRGQIFDPAAKAYVTCKNCGGTGIAGE